jgi:hypothetical protein
MNCMRFVNLLALILLCSACLERSETEAAGYSSFVMKPGVEIRPLERTLAAKTKLDLNDGLSGPLIPLRTGYVAGHEVQYWDLGTAPTTAEPIWRFKRHDGTKVEHPPLVDSIPGDTVYSPIRILFDVYVTPRWQGEQFPSLRAVDDGVELGLLEDPIQTDLFTNCVVTIAETQLEAGDNRPPHNPTVAYYRGRSINQFCVDELTGNDGMFMSKMGSPVFGTALMLRRENQMLSLDESLFKTDLNGDGDMTDANVVFDADIGDAGYTSLWKNMDVVVSDDYVFGTLESQDSMFDKKPWGLSPKDPRVVEVKDTMTILNRPLRPVVAQVAQ